MKKDAQRTARLEARLPHVIARVKRAAEIQGRTVTDFVETAADEAARQTIGQTELMRLSIEDQGRIAAVILNPPNPGPALLRAAERYRELFDVE